MRMALMAALATALALAGMVGQAEAAAQMKKGTFAKITTAGTQTVTGVGFQPKAVIFFWTKQTAEGYSAGISEGIGFAAAGTPITMAANVVQAPDAATTPNDAQDYHSTNSAIVTLVKTANPTTIETSAVVASFNADGFSLTWTGTGTADIIHYTAIGGTDVAAARVGTSSMLATAGTQTVTGVGFQPEGVFLLSNNRTTAINTLPAAGRRPGLNFGFMANPGAPCQVSIGWGMRDGQTAATHGSVFHGGQALTIMRGNLLDANLTYTSFDADGFRLNSATAPGATNISWLAIDGPKFSAGTFSQPTSAGTYTKTGESFQPTALWLLSTNSTAGNGVIDTANPGASFTLGASDGTTEGAMWMHNTGFNPNDANTSSISTKVIRHALSTATTNAEADLVSFTSDGFILNWTTADATARRSAYIVMGSNIVDITPPVAGTVTVTPDASGYTSSAPTIVTPFTDAESALQSCQYTTNGSTWLTGTPGGTSPDFTCTANPTALSGTLTINMSAISSGGTTTASSISRIVDTTAPSLGTLIVTPSDQQNNLSWSGISDGESGMKATGTYTIRWVQNATPPANCTANNLLGTYDAGATSAPHSGLMNGLVYSYRLCATNGVDLQNAGVTASGTPNPVPHEDVGVNSNTPIATTANDSQPGVVMQRFQVTSATGTPPGTPQDSKVTLTSLGLNDIGTAAFVANARVYIDTTSSAALPGTATLIGQTGGWNAQPVTVTLDQGGTARDVLNSTPKYIYILYDMQSGQVGLTVQSQVTSLGVAAPDGSLTGQTLNSNSFTLTPGPKYAVSCGDCHATPPVDAPVTRNVPTGAVFGDHYKHAASTQYNYPCNTCHTPLASGYTTTHRNGLIQMQTTSIQGGSYGRGASFLQTNDITGANMNRCNNTYCHSNGAGGTYNGGDTRSIATNASPTWGKATVTCASCHGTPPSYANGDTTWGAAKRNSHAAHTTDCSKCHNTTTTDGTTIASTAVHVDRTYDLKAGTGVWFTAYTYNVGGGTCNFISCHGNTSAQWGVTQVNCLACHAGTQTKTLGGGGTIRQVVGANGDFWNSVNGVMLGAQSRHLRWATTFTVWDCIICHMEGWYTGAGGSPGRSNSTYHNDGSGSTGGKINLRDVDNPSTGWAIDNRAWGTTDYTNMDLFCLNCHDANGASGIAVNATNNGNEVGTNVSRRLTPFNTSDTRVISGRTLLDGSTIVKGGYRERVANIKDMFYAGSAGAGANYNGNPSQHAVIGRRYSTVWTSWSVAAWSSQYVLKKLNITQHVARETAVLSCADCHVLDAGANGNAHRARTPYFMWTTAVKNMCWRCHNASVYIASPSAGTSVAGSRIDHSAIDGGRGGGPYTAYGLAGGSGADWNCLLCHASWSGFTTATRVASYGGIHGSWNTTASWYTFITWDTQNPAFGSGGRQAYRFTPGVAFIMGPPTNTPSNAAWNSGGTFSCYFYDDATAMGYSNCNQHAPADGLDFQPPSEYRRPVAY